MDNFETITGEIEVLGESQVDSGGTFYSYIRVLDENKNVKMLKNIIVFDTVNSYFSPGARGSIFLIRLGSKGYIAFAYKNETRYVFAPHEMRDVARAFRAKGILWICTLPIAAISVIFFGLGFLLTPICLYMVYVYFLKLPKMVRVSNLAEYLQKHGFTCLA